MESMPKSPKKYPPEVREQALRLLKEWRDARGRSNGGFVEIAAQLNIHSETLRGWDRQRAVDTGVRPGLTTDDKTRIAELERENRELKRANDILKTAAAFFARELDPRLPK